MKVQGFRLYAYRGEGTRSCFVTSLVLSTNGFEEGK